MALSMALRYQLILKCGTDGGLSENEPEIDICGSFNFGRDQLNLNSPLILSIASLTAFLADSIFSENDFLMLSNFSDAALFALSSLLEMELFTESIALDVFVFTLLHAVVTVVLILPNFSETNEYAELAAPEIVDVTAFHASPAFVLTVSQF